MDRTPRKARCAVSHRNLIARLCRIDTPTLSNAIEKMRVRSRTSGFCDSSLRCLFPELGVMCGYAVTAEVETMNPDKEGVLDRPFVELCEAIHRTQKPVVVVMREIGPHREFCAHCGEVLATVFTRLGAVGLVSDAAVRDLKEVRALGFHYFATGTVASHGNFRIVRVQVPVTVCGLHIRPGDLLHGDANGLILVPAEGRERLPQLAAEVVKTERNFIAFVKSGKFSIQQLKTRITH
ncbi:MAG: RraA family protein [Kiritimatiellae bacterium]|nr:RraA family protein [Kiritimatiellia bacterium]